MTVQQITPDDVIDIEELESLIPYEDDGNKEGKAHIINPPMNTHIWRPGMEAQDIANIARARGLEVIALCGYRHVPKNDPEKREACEAFFKIAGDIMRLMGE